jgi:nicotinamide-nucleotide amidase
MFSKTLMDDAVATLASLRARGLMCVTAESCTGGLIAGLLTAVAGSSDVVERGFVTYSNLAKVQMLGVPESLLAAHGAVSSACAEVMARGALAASGAQIAVSVTGVAGPGGGSADKPVGLVYLAVAMQGGVRVIERHFGAVGRDSVREFTVINALKLLREGP